MEGEQAGEITAADADTWKHGIYGLMMLWGLEPDDLVALIPRLARCIDRTSHRSCKVGSHSNRLRSERKSPLKARVLLANQLSREPDPLHASQCLTDSN